MECAGVVNESDSIYFNFMTAIAPVIYVTAVTNQTLLRGRTYTFALFGSGGFLVVNDMSIKKICLYSEATQNLFVSQTLNTQYIFNFMNAF